MATSFEAASKPPEPGWRESMRFELRSRGKLVGWSDPAELDRAAAIGFGAFSPGPDYADAEPVFRLWARAQSEPDPVAKERLLSRYAAERRALALEVWGPDGAVWPTTSIHVVGLRDGTLELEVRFREIG